MNWRRGNKFNAVKTESHGIWFDSKLESSVHRILKEREAAGELRILGCQDVVRLSRACIRTEPDFKCLDIKTNEEFWVEAKGFEGPRWPTIKKLWQHYGPGRIEIWKGNHKKPFEDEIIIPKRVICPHCGE